MEQGHLIMSNKKRSRFLVLDRFEQGQMNMKQAATELGISYRQAQRSRNRLKTHDATGLVHIAENCG